MLKPYERPSSTNLTAAQRARRAEAAAERARLQARAPFDRAADAAERAERELRLAFEALPPSADDLRRSLILSAVNATGLVPLLRRAAEQAQADVT